MSGPFTPALVPSSSAGGLPTEVSEDVHLNFVVIDGGVKEEPCAMVHIAVAVGTCGRLMSPMCLRP